MTNPQNHRFTRLPRRLGTSRKAAQNGGVTLRKARKTAVWIEDRPPRRGGAPAPVGQVLAETQKATSQRTGAALSPDEWRRVVGAKIATRTRVGRLGRGTLTVYAASSAWCNELSFLSTDILSRLRDAGFSVDALQIRVGKFEPLTAEPSGASTPSHAQLPPELRARLALIDDPELRAAVADAAAASLSNPRLAGPVLTRTPPGRGAPTHDALERTAEVPRPSHARGAGARSTGGEGERLRPARRRG